VNAQDRGTIDVALEDINELLGRLDRKPSTESDRELRLIYSKIWLLGTRTQSVLSRNKQSPMAPPNVDFDEHQHQQIRETLRSFLRGRRDQLNTLLRQP
jgi:hypothetical protein